MTFASSSALGLRSRGLAAALCILVMITAVPSVCAFTVLSGTYSIRDVDADGRIYRANIIKLQTSGVVYVEVPECPDGESASRDHCGPAEGLVCCPDSHPYYCSDSHAGTVCSNGGQDTYALPNPPPQPTPQRHRLSEATRRDIGGLSEIRNDFFSISCAGFTPPELPEDDHGPGPGLLPQVPRPLDEFFTSLELNQGVRKLERRRRNLERVDPSQTGNLVPAPEVNAALNAVPPNVDGTMLALISFVSVYNPVDGSTVTMGPGKEQFTAGCTISFNDLTDADGNTLSSFSDFTEQELTCDAAAIRDTVLPALESALVAVRDQSVYDSGYDPEFRVLKVAGSEEFSGCRDFITSALQFTETAQTETTKSCGEAYGSNAWLTDPCCNKALQATKCCRATAKSITRELLTGVDTNRFAEACSPQGVVPATVAAEALVSVRSAAYDAETGCAAKMVEARQTLDSLHQDVQDCMQSVFWQQQSASCQTDVDCTLTEECLSTTQGSKQCAPVPSDRKGEYMFKCLRLKLPDLFFRVLRKQYSIPQTATDAQAAQQLESQLSIERCVGPTGWQHSGRYEQGGRWVDGNATACVASKGCNYNWWDNLAQVACESDELGGFFCGECWSDHQCREVSAAPRCIVAEDNHMDAQACTGLDASYSLKRVDWFDRCVSEATSAATCTGPCTATGGPKPTDAMWCVRPDTSRAACEALQDPQNGIWPSFSSQVWDPSVGRWGGVWRTNVCIMWSVHEEARCSEFSGFEWTVNPWDRRESKCRRTMCYSLSQTQQECWSRSSSGKNFWWDSNLNDGAGACMMNSWSGSVTQRKLDCEAEGNGFTFYNGFRFQPGEVYTENMCEQEGVCDIWGVASDECSNYHRCTGHCPGCQSTYQSPSGGALCYRAGVADSSACSALGGTWDQQASLCTFPSISEREECTSTAYNGTFLSCADLAYDQCESNEAQGALYCQKNQWGQCGDQAACESNGRCEGAWFSTGFYDQQANRWVELEQLCRLDYQYKPEYGGYECPSIQSLQPQGQSWHMDYSPVGCLVPNAYTEALCGSINGTLVPVPRTREQCESWKMCCAEGESCNFAPWGYSPLGQQECEVCSGNYQNIFNWVTGSWVTGSLKPLQWKQRRYGPENEWKSQVDDSRFWMMLESVREEMEMTISSDYLKCMYSGFSSFLETIACSCGINQETCGSSVSSEIEFEAESGTAFAGSESNSRTFASRIKTSANSIDPNTNNGVNTFNNRIAPASSLQSKPKEVNGVRVDGGSGGSGRRRLQIEAHGLRRLSSTSDSSDCYTVVQNSNAKVVGQIVGPCVSVQPVHPLANPVELCVSVDASVPINANFDTPLMGVRVTSGSDRIIRVATSTEASAFNTQRAGTEYCASISGTNTYCPIRVLSSYASATTSIAASCEKLDAIVTTVVQKQIQLGKAQASAGALSGPSVAMTLLAALAATLAVRRGAGEQ